MSLQVWLPLNGDLHNQGLSKINIINNGATINNNGKIGKCYNVNNSMGIIVNNSITLGTTFSIVCWIKINSYNQDWANAFKIYKDGYDYIGLCMNQANATTKQLGFHIYKNNGSNARTGVTDGYYMPLAIGEWYHLCFIVTPTQVITYQDGVKIKTNDITINFPSIINYNLSLGKSSLFSGLDCSINDFRLYDHALSAKEVKEISKGLVLHYKLDNNGLGGENLVLGSNTNSVSTNAWTMGMQTGDKTITIERDDNNTPILVITRGSTTQSGWRYIGYTRLLVDKIKVSTNYTISFDIYSTVSGTISFYGFARSNALDHLEQSITTIQGNVIANKWNHIVFQCLTKSDFSGLSVGSQIVYFTFSNEFYNTNVISKFRNIKVEEGFNESPWSPADSEIISNQILIYDSSGYNYNGEIINSVSIESNSPKYRANTYISATNQKIKISRFTTTGFANSYSFSWWGKASAFTSGAMIWGFADGIRLNGFHTGTLWNTGDGGNNPLYQPGTTTQVTAPVGNIWHHFVMTGDGTTCKAYMDGQLWGQAKTYKSISGTTIYLNGWDSGTSYCFSDLSISDFRIYATALSADDIKELYRTSKIVSGTTVSPRNLE